MVACVLGVTSSAGDFSFVENSRSLGCAGCHSGSSKGAANAVDGLRRLKAVPAVPAAAALAIDKRPNWRRERVWIRSLKHLSCDCLETVKFWQLLG
jgi:hypothetical protein